MFYTKFMLAGFELFKQNSNHYNEYRCSFFFFHRSILRKLGHHDRSFHERYFKSCSWKLYKYCEPYLISVIEGVETDYQLILRTFK